MTFKAAIFISCALHLLALSSWNIFHIRNFEKEKNTQIEVFYVLEEDKKTPEKVIENLPKMYDLEQKKLTLAQKEPAKIESKRISLEEVIKSEHFPDEEPDYIDAENLEEYISYYQLIRENIKKYVAHRYANPSEEGEVYVIFRLSSMGELKRLSVNELKSAKSESLKQVALESVRQAAPFPPFPAALNKRELTFSIAIIFRRN